MAARAFHGSLCAERTDRAKERNFFSKQLELLAKTYYRLLVTWIQVKERPGIGWNMSARISIEERTGFCVKGEVSLQITRRYTSPPLGKKINKIKKFKPY